MSVPFQLSMLDTQKHRLFLHSNTSDSKCVNFPSQQHFIIHLSGYQLPRRFQGFQKLFVTGTRDKDQTDIPDYITTSHRITAFENGVCQKHTYS